ncbi:MAG: (deoxy)nucleoside triphosphate pyrophosphohydrolase [Deferrisomatales bacterium]|nr:(deoxy)nucleoside triphosphate pyrophosphohydrolase [Deferrisomatales bacterium]
MVRVTAAVIDRGGQILIAKRRQDARLGGLWEFPGGKIEDGEDARDCLARELHEELGIAAEIGEFLVSHVHHYPHLSIELLSYRAVHVAGEFELRDHDEVQWVRPEEMGAYEFAPADLPTVAFLQAACFQQKAAQGG